MPGVKKGVFGELQVGLVGALYISGEDTCTWGLLRPGRPAAGCLKRSSAKRACEAAVCSCGDERQLHPWSNQQRRRQRAERRGLPFLLGVCVTVPGVLCSVLSSPAWR